MMIHFPHGVVLEMEEIEALMAEPFTGAAPRDEEKVEWYRGMRPAGTMR